MLDGFPVVMSGGVMGKVRQVRLTLATFKEANVRKAIIANFSPSNALAMHCVLNGINQTEPTQ